MFSTKRACRSCGRSFPELDPRLFSYNSKHGWCAACYGTGLQIDEVEWDDERARTGAEDNVLDSWIEWLELDEACPECEGKRLNPEALRCAGASKNIARLRRASRFERCKSFFEKSSSQAASARSRATSLAELDVAPRLPRGGRPGLPHARPLGADALGRRGAAHPAGRAARLQPARRVLHPRRADHRPAPARQRDPARRAGEARGQGQHAGGGRARRGHHPPRAST